MKTTNLKPTIMKNLKQICTSAVLLFFAGNSFLMAQNNTGNNELTFKSPTYIASAIFNWPQLDADSKGYNNLDFFLTIEKEAPNFYWAQQFSFKNGKTGYMGLQNSASYKGEKTKIAIFSIWEAKTVESPNGFAKAFGHEGFGYSCRIKYNWQEGRKYRVRVWELGKAEAPNSGTWWGSWVMDMETGKEEFIGKILVPDTWEWLNATSYNFTEYWGSQDGNRHPCSSIGYTKTIYDFPTMANGTVKPTKAIFERNDECASLTTTGQIGPNTYKVEAGSQ
ncbi:MAG: DUF3472 domain-containing protein [Aequorivita sp.]|nr:DUF3472 domain-containing protein [Aequorivita sp.]MBF32318.1 DUF3472 domain-containing protein [Aequorivita sp.]|tara:strand:- start:54138 stop:54974 length:837 start_codon:yes stop_codon:yes gene_type:complete